MILWLLFLLNSIYDFHPKINNLDFDWQIWKRRNMITPYVKASCMEMIINKGDGSEQFCIMCEEFRLKVGKDEELKNNVIQSLKKEKKCCQLLEIAKWIFDTNNIDISYGWIQSTCQHQVSCLNDNNACKLCFFTTYQP